MINFQKELDTTKPLWVFNNNVLRFNEDSPEASLYCIISTTFFEVTIYPDDSGNFYFNLKDELIAESIKNNLFDLLDLDIDATIPSLIEDETVDSMLKADFNFKVYLEGVEDPIETDKSYHFFKGVEQLERFQRQEVQQKEAFILSRLNEYSRKEYYLNYWAGFPFSFSYYSSTSGDLNIENLNTSIDIDIAIAQAESVNRIIFSDGKSNVSIENHLPLEFGINRLQLTRPGYDSQTDEDLPLLLNINKREESCGIYLKFRNEFGGWNYWLFSERHNETFSVKSNKPLYNNFENIEDTVSPYIQTGSKESKTQLTCFARKLSKEDRRYLSYIVSSPKIYLYTSLPFASLEDDSRSEWIEIECLTKKFAIISSRNQYFNLKLDFALPKHENVSLV